MLRQPVDRLHRRQMLFLIGEQLKREELGKDYEVRPVIRGDVDEIFDVVDEFLEALHRPRLELAGGDADALDVTRHAEAGRLVRIRSEEHTSELQSLMRISYA